MEKRGTKWLAAATQLGFVIIMLVPFISGQLHIYGLRGGLVQTYGQHIMVPNQPMNVSLELNDPVPTR